MDLDLSTDVSPFDSLKWRANIFDMVTTGAVRLIGVRVGVAMIRS